MTRPTLALTLAALLPAGAALAHTGHGETAGLVAGLGHPILGLDHLLAMVAVGLWSGLALPRAVWGGAAAFVGAMALGAGLGFAGVALPWVEAGIVASVVIFGLMTLLASPDQGRAVTAGSLAAIGLFALFHGHAHATEASGAAGPYMAGFLLATAGLHLAGIVLARRIVDRVALRALGGAIAASGLALMLG